MIVREYGLHSLTITIIPQDMTKKDYIVIADILGNKLEQLDTWHNAEAYSLGLAYLEDFIKTLKTDNANFDKVKFIGYINKKYNRNIE